MMIRVIRGDIFFQVVILTVKNGMDKGNDKSKKTMQINEVWYSK